MRDDTNFSDALRSILGLQRPNLSPPTTPHSLSDYLTQSPPKPPYSALNDFKLPISTKGISLRIAPTPPKNETELSSRISRDTKTLLSMKMQLIQAQKIPTPQEVAINEVKVIKTSVLHVDMRRSSDLLDIFDPIIALRVYKVFHAALVATARFKNGRVRTFAGDRIGVIFDLNKERPRSIAVETALLMEEMINNIVNPILSTNIKYEIEYGIGIDYGQMFVGKIGQSGTDNNDLAWVGKAMNTASKLADIPKPGIYITDSVFTGMLKNLKDSSMIWEKINNSEYGIIHKWLLKV